MDFIAKKYTILVGEEPITIWAKNGVVKKAIFMERKVPFELDKNIIEKIKAQPAKIINGNIFKDNEAFTKATSKMFSQQLKAAIAKKDLKTMSRFARSELIPQEMQQEFIEAINKKRGLRAVVVNLINKTNLSIQKMAAKIDKFLDKINDRAANQKVDKYLQKYQTKSLNKIVENYRLPADILDKTVDEKLAQKAREFIKEHEDIWSEHNDLKKFDSSYYPHHKKMAEFLDIMTKQGYTALDCQVAFAQQMQYQKLIMNSNELARKTDAILNAAWRVENAAAKNKTLDDFKILALDKTPMQKLDLLIENEEYQKLDQQKQQEIEDKYLYSNDNSKSAINERAQELKEILNIKQQEVQQPTKKYSFTKEDINKEWKIAQAESRSKTIPTQKFMDYSALKFDGVDINNLNTWKQQMNEMREKGKKVPSVQKVNEFIDGTLNNAKRLQAEGILKEKEKNVFEFVNDDAKEQLYTKLKTKEQEIDLKERVKDLSSEKSFEKIIAKDGSVDIEKLATYAQKLSEIAAMAKNQQNVNISKSELKRDTQMVQAQTNSQQNTKGQER